MVKGLLRPRLERRLERVEPQRRERGRRLGGWAAKFTLGSAAWYPGM